jgi:hypothetical protein
VTRGKYVVLLLAALVPAAASAQQTAALVERGVRAYQTLDYETAAALLRRALAAPAPDTATSVERVRALTYLAASDFYRDRRDSTAAVFRRLVLTAPRARPDPLIFPPEVTALYDAARRATKAVAAELPDTTVDLNGGRYPIRLAASSFHEIVVALEQEDGRFLRGLYVGPIGDTLLVRWDGTDSAGVPLASGAYVLTVTSRPTPGGEILRVLRVPLEVRAGGGRDTLPWPASPPAPLPERAPSGPALRVLAAGVLTGTAALALPGVVAKDAQPTGARFAVAGAVSLAGILGYFAHKPGRPLPQNAIANRARAAAWQVLRDSVRRENGNRRREVRLTVRSGAPVIIDRESP